MSTYEPTLFVEPLGYQPAEFLDIPPMRELVEAPAVEEQRPRSLAHGCQIRRRLITRAGRPPHGVPAGS
jgi:hypothetical protein